MKDREEARAPSNIPELIRRTKCSLRTCPNYDHNCLVLPQQKHVSLSSNDFVIWDKAIEDSKATLDVPPLSVRGVPVPRKKSPVAISNITGSFNQPVHMMNPGQSSTFQVPYPVIYGYNQYLYVMPGMPQLPATPVRRHDLRGILSSPIDVSSSANNDVSGFMNWMIERTREEREVEALIQAKEKLLEAMADLDIIKNMSNAEFAALNIPFGLGKRLAQEVKCFIKK